MNAEGELTVDHYQPVSKGGDNQNENLVYACVRCNLYKSDYWATEDDINAGHFVLHPQHDKIEQHFQENELTGELEALTETGQFHITLLDLNRLQLIAHRQRVWIQSLSDEIQHSLQKELSDLKTELQAYTRYPVCHTSLRENPERKVL